MHLLGVWLASYYDWWLARVEKRPLLWQIEIFLGFSIGLLLFSGLEWPLWIFVVLTLACVPGFFAAGRVQKRKNDEQFKRHEETQRAIKMKASISRWEKKDKL